MSALGPHRYRLATPAQWGAGLLVRADVAPDGTLAPSAAWGVPPTRWPSPAGATAPAIAPDGIAYWTDHGLGLASFAADDDAPRAQSAPQPIAAARRIVAGRTNLWVAGAGPRLYAFVRGSLAPRITVDLPVDEIVDLTADDRDGVWVLARTGGTHRLLHVDCAGQQAGDVAVPSAIRAPHALGYLAAMARFALLAREGTRLYWFPESGREEALETSWVVARARANATWLASDGRARAAVAGIDQAVLGGGAWAVTLDEHGDALTRLELPEPPTGVALGARSLAVTTAHATLLFSPATPLRPSSVETTAVLVSPALRSPPAAGRAPWLRAEAQIALSAGASVEFRWAATDDPTVLRDAEAIARDPRLSAAQRWERLQARLAWSAPLRFAAAADTGADASTGTFAAPLHDVRQPWLWVAVTLVAAPGAAVPRMHSLDVLYPDESLMRHLPAIYRRQAEQPGDFLRGLVGVLEATTGGLDARIAGLGALLDPATTAEPWLDTLARWLGLPWDDGLPLAAKRALLAATPRLLDLRGTRAGMETLLACLLPAGRYRVVDIMADHGFAQLGGPGCQGTALPSLLTGLSTAALVLGRKGRLGKGSLPCDGLELECAAPYAGAVEVEVIASAPERASWAWLAPLLDEMAPATARVALRWSEAPSARPYPILDETLTLEDEPDARLGAGARLGEARLADDRRRTLVPHGVDLGFRLQ